MNRLTKVCLIGIIVSLASCATSMSPIQVNNTLPTLTKSKFVSQPQADENAKTGKCKYLVKNRNYVVPIELSTREELKSAAKAIDEWVNLDGGNAYVLKNYKWVAVDQNGSTQLHIEFDTMLCE